MRTFLHVAFVRPLCNQHRAAAVSLLLAFVTFLLYWPVHRHEFNSYDDEPYVTENPLVIQGLTTRGIIWAFTGAHFYMWHPLTTISHMMDCQLFGLNAGAHHLVSIVLHSATAGLLFLLLNDMTRASWRSAMVAALFAWHPLRVESVAWVAERKDVMCGLFWMLTLLAYARYAANGTPVRYILAVLTFGLGIMTKPMIVTLPFVLLLLDVWPLQRFQRVLSPGGKEVSRITAREIISRLRPLLFEKVPFFVLSAFLAAMTLLAQRQGGVIVTLERSPFSRRVATALISYLAYVKKMVWPTDLAIFYPIPESWPAWYVFLSAVFLLAVTVLGIRTLKCHPYVLVGWLWYLGVLVPAIGLVQVSEQALADRYSYLPMIGMLIVIAWGIPELLANCRFRPQVLSVLGAVALTGCLMLTRQQLKHWQNATALFAHALEVTKDNYLAHSDLGVALFKEGRTSEAIEHYREALRIRPDDFNPRLNLANALESLGDHVGAIREYTEALRLNSRDAKAHTGLGIAFAAMGRTKEAFDQYEKALEADPKMFELHYSVGKLMASRGMYTGAVPHLERAVQLRPTNVVARNQLGLALMQQGKYDDAILQFVGVLQTDKLNFDAHADLGAVLYKQGKLSEAIAEFSEALKINPEDAATHVNLGNTLTTDGKQEEAIQHYRQALSLDSGSVDAHNFLGVALFKAGKNEEALFHYEEALRAKPDHFGAHYDAGRIRLGQKNYLESIKHLSACLELRPTDAGAHYQLGLALAGDHKCDQAVKQFREALRFRPDFPAALHALAWILATYEDPRLRNGIEAVRLATRAVELTTPPSPEILNGLAAAQAETGNFNEAVVNVRKAIDLATSSNRIELAKELTQRLLLYQQHQPYRDITLSARAENAK